MAIRLTVVSPDRRERVVEIEAGRVTIGRASACAVQIDDPDAAAEHCVLERTEAGRYKVVDLETRAGTSVNGERVNVRLLENGDRIRIGAWSFLFGAPERATDPGSQTDRIHLRRRRGSLLRRRRVVLPPKKKAPQVFSFEDLRVVVDSLIEEKGVGALDEIRVLLDQRFEEHKGAPLYDALVEERDTLLRMMQINKLINSEHDQRRLLDVIMDTVIELAGAERGFLILREKGSLAIKVARNFDREAIKKPEFKISHSVAEEVIRTGKPVLSADALNDPTLPSAGSVTDLKLRSLLCLPFKVREQTIGCVYIDNRFETGIFLESDLPMLEGFADQAAIAIENARLFEENELRREEIERLNAQLKERVEKQYVELTKVTRDYLAARPAVELRHDFSGIVGKSRPLQEVFALLDKVIDTDESVYVNGESGTGKELIARAFPENSRRAKSGRFVSENCSAIPDSLLESELFGHEKGAFTGAVATKPGLFEQAHQ
ncbi:MAG: sigma 54-interacting transcriptional regulator, partial [Planctomycetes bacterium]|nr:sigma 54-interacting transcriptional regulator [Planctomycetota bacterium]